MVREYWSVGGNHALLEDVPGGPIEIISIRDRISLGRYPNLELAQLWAAHIEELQLLAEPLCIADARVWVSALLKLPLWRCQGGNSAVAIGASRCGLILLGQCRNVWLACGPDRGCSRAAGGEWDHWQPDQSDPEFSWLVRLALRVTAKKYA